MNIQAMFLFQWFNGIKEINFKDIFLLVSHVQLCPVMSANLNFHPMFILVHLGFDHVGSFRKSVYSLGQMVLCLSLSPTVKAVRCLIRNKSHFVSSIVDTILNFEPLNKPIKLHYSSGSHVEYQIHTNITNYDEVHYRSNPAKSDSI